MDKSFSILYFRNIDLNWCFVGSPASQNRKMDHQVYGEKNKTIRLEAARKTIAKLKREAIN
jgi:hypothetical protein